MPTPFPLFGFPHLVIVALIPLVAVALARWSRWDDTRTEIARYSLAGLILVNELVWYWYYVHQGWFEFPYTLPLHLCDMVLWLTIYTLFSQKSWSYELIYYWGLAGTTMAVLTPDVSTPPISYLTIRFFVAHGGIIAAILFLTWRKLLRPTKGSFWRAWLALQVYAVGIALFNQIFRTNYFFICEKPEEFSLLNYMGPWPVYIIIGDLLALMFFWLLWLPFRRSTDRT
jgi:hypothetical integral membrane protein (TIGR02206 family)